MSQATLDRGPSPRLIRARRYDRPLAIAAAGTVLAFGIALHAWCAGVHLFAGPGASETAPVALGHTLYVGLGPLRAGQPNSISRINLRSITPLVAENSADAEIRVLECDALTAGSSASLTAGGVVLDDVAPYCVAVKPIRTGAISVGPRANGFVLAVTPRHTGVVRVDGARMSYRVGVRSGRQRIGAVILTANTP